MCYRSRCFLPFASRMKLPTTLPTCAMNVEKSAIAKLLGILIVKELMVLCLLRVLFSARLFAQHVSRTFNPWFVYTNMSTGTRLNA